VLWLVAANDSYFSPELSRQMADAFRNGGGKVDFRVLAASGSEGHWLAESEAGVKLFGPALDSALKTLVPAPVKSDDRGAARGPTMTSFSTTASAYSARAGSASWPARDVYRRFRFTAIHPATARGWRRPSASTRKTPTPMPSSMAASHISNPTRRSRCLAICRVGMGARVVRGAKPLRDKIYSLVARNRYRIFGKFEECFVPDAEMRAQVME